MSEKEPAGKVTGTNVEKLIVNGLDVERKDVGDVVEITIPKEILDKGGEAITKFKKATLDRVEAGNRNYKKGQELNQERKEFDNQVAQRNAEIEKKDKELKLLQEKVAKQEEVNVELSKRQVKENIPSLKKLLAKRLGKETLTADEIRDVIDDDPEMYLSIQTERQDLLAEKLRNDNYQSIKGQVSKDLFADTIRREGFNLAEVERFRLDNGFNSIESAFSFFKTQNKPTISPIDIINKAESTKKTVKFIETGNVEHANPLKLEDMTAEQVDALSDEDNKRLYNEMVSRRR